MGAGEGGNFLVVLVVARKASSLVGIALTGPRFAAC